MGMAGAPASLLRGACWLAAAVAVSAVPSFSAGATEVVESVPLGSRVTVDGHFDEWNGIPVHFLADSVHVLAVANDADTLYVMFRFSEPDLARSILRRGVVLWLDGDGRKRTSFGVRYGGSEEVAASLAGARGTERTAPPPAAGHERGRRARRRSEPEPGTVVVISGDGSDAKPEQLPGGPVAASALADGVYCYEVAVPLRMVGGELERQPATAERRLELGLQIGGLSDAERRAMRGGHRGWGGLHLGLGGGGGEMEGRGRGRGSEEREPREGRDSGPAGGRTDVLQASPRWLEVVLPPMPSGRQ